MYSKHKWESDKYYNFRYVKYLPSDFDETYIYSVQRDMTVINRKMNERKSR